MYPPRCDTILLPMRRMSVPARPPDAEERSAFALSLPITLRLRAAGSCPGNPPEHSPRFVQESGMGNSGARPRILDIAESNASRPDGAASGEACGNTIQGEGGSLSASGEMQCTDAAPTAHCAGGVVPAGEPRVGCSNTVGLGVSAAPIASRNVSHPARCSQAIHDDERRVELWKLWLEVRVQTHSSHTAVSSSRSNSRAFPLPVTRFLHSNIVGSRPACRTSQHGCSLPLLDCGQAGNLQGIDVGAVSHHAQGTECRRLAGSSVMHVELDRVADDIGTYEFGFCGEVATRRDAAEGGV